MTDTDRTTLVLAPLTPNGSRGYLERVAQACAATDSLAAISYTQSPAAWAANWLDAVGPLPDRSVFFYGGMQASEEEEAPFDEVVTVDPTDPMSIITGVEQRLDEWRDEEGRPVVSVQTLSVLLEYVDFDTAFRYLYLLVQKIEASNAVGYFQIDPHLHEAEELNTLRSLFDSVIELSDGEWTEATPYQASTEADEESASASSFRPMARLSAFLGNCWARLGALASSPGSSSSTTDAETDSSAESQSSGAETTPEVTLTEEELLTDEERIKRFLQLSGGRARQAEMTDEFSWSASTVSRKLSKMEAADEISRVKIGRENVVFLESSEPEALQSPIESKSDPSSTTETGQ